MQRACGRGAAELLQSRGKSHRVRASALGWLGIAGWLACTEAAQASTLALVEDATPQGLRAGLDEARLRPLVEIGPAAAVVELGADERERLAASRLRVVEAGAPALFSGTGSLAERVFRRAVARRPLRGASVPACSTQIGRAHV